MINRLRTNPFDQVGQDDVTINAEKFMERLAVAPATPSPQGASDQMSEAIWVGGTGDQTRGTG